MNICVITYQYPSKYNRSSYAFVKQLVDAMAKHGHHCYVLAPFNITHIRRLAGSREEYTQGDGVVTVLRPGYISLSTLHFGKFKPSQWLHKKALNKAFRMLDVKPDVIYCHFWGSGYKGYYFAKKFNIPLFVASGESNIKKLFTMPSDVVEFDKYVKGVICVSSKNRDESVGLGLTSFDKCRVFPNAVNKELFHLRDRQECRKALRLPLDAFIVAFVGWFTDRKGPQRVAAAIEKVGGVKSVFIGRGDIEPQCDGILFNGFIPHDNVPIYLGAADCFVLPTQAEGCCNAVVEAMACGLPVISSNLPFNWDVLDETNSIMVDPMNVDEIADAIRLLRDNQTKRKELSEGALMKASNLTIEKRAEGILNFMEEMRKG